MSLDPLFLSRLQWAGVIGWHILLPAFTVGLASYIAVLEGLFFFSGKDIWFRISRFWTRIFSVSFAMGVVTGIIMPLQFGTNWSRFSDATGARWHVTPTPDTSAPASRSTHSCRWARRALATLV